MAKSVRVEAYKGLGSTPFQEDDCEIVEVNVMQFTDFDHNFNKYYEIELHKSSAGKWRVFTHYGRTDDLEKNPDAGKKECRHFASESVARECFNNIITEKLKKGYNKIELAHSNIGSDVRKSRSGAGEDKEDRQLPPAEFTPSSSSSLSPTIQKLVHYIFYESAKALSSSVAAKITSRGIETPLGILTKEQVERGEAVLSKIFDILKEKEENFSPDELANLRRLSGEFFTIIPHRIGRSKSDVHQNVIDSAGVLESKQELLQLMKDMLEVTSSGAYDKSDKPTVDLKFRALKVQLKEIDKYSPWFQEIQDYVLNSQRKTARFNKKMEIETIYAVRRPQETDSFKSEFSPQKLLFHGSRISNWVGLLSRGVLMPKVIVRSGVKRTDAGLLGNGMYFASSASASAQYTTAGETGSQFMMACRVALGQSKEYNEPVSFLLIFF